MLPHPSYHFLTLSSLSIIAYFPSFLTHLSHIPWEEQNRTCTVECGTRERDVAQWVWISGRISHNPGIIFPSMPPQSHPSYPARSSPPVISPTLFIQSTSPSPTTETSTNMWQFLRMAFQKLFLLKHISKASHSALSSWLTFSMASVVDVGGLDVMGACGCCGACVLQWQPLEHGTRWRHSTMSQHCLHHQHSSSARQNVSISCGTVLPCVNIFCWSPLATAAALSEATITPKIAIQDFSQKRLWRKLWKMRWKMTPSGNWCIYWSCICAFLFQHPSPGLNKLSPTTDIQLP